MRHSSGTLRLLAESGGTSTVNNEDGAVWEIVTNGVLLSGGAYWGHTWFNNFGRLAKIGGDGISRLDLDTSSGLAYGGFCNFGGAIEVRSGRLELAAEGVYSNGTYTADAGAVLHLGGGRNITCKGTLLGEGDGVVLWEGGTWGGGGSADVAISNFCWRGGQLSADLGNTGRMTMDQADKTNWVWHGSLRNNGLFRMEAGLLCIHAQEGGQSRVDNNGGAVWEVYGSGTVVNGGTIWGAANFNNRGRFVKKAGSGTATFTLDISGSGSGGFQNLDGAVEVCEGTLVLQSIGIRSNGVYTAAAGTVLDLNGGRNIQVSGTLQGADEGAVVWNGGTWSGGANLAMSNFCWRGGNLGGGIDNLGRMTFDAANATNTVWHGGLKNSGLLRQTGGVLRIHAQEGGSSSVENATGGVWQIAADGAAVFGGTGWGTVTFKNHGSLVKSAGEGAATVSLQYGGSGGGGFQNYGDIAVQSGTLHIGDRFTHTGGRLTVDEGAALHLPAFTLNGGTLAGGGTLVTPTLTSAGTVAPGASIGRLTVTGNYAQGGSGALAVEIGGREPGITHDQLAVSGSASLSGELNVSFAPGFIPALNDSFVVLTCASRSGTFSQTHLADDLYEWTIDYSPTAVVLRATAPVLATNGVPAVWLAGFGWTNNFDEAALGDQDGDGAWTWQEYVMDTCPTNAASFLRIAAISNGPPVTVVFDSASVTRDYTLQATTNLVTGPWADVPGQGPRPGAGGQDAMSEASGEPARFYRVKVEVP